MCDGPGTLLVCLLADTQERLETRGSTPTQCGQVLSRNEQNTNSLFTDFIYKESRWKKKHSIQHLK